MTKEEIRAIIIDKLDLFGANTLLDVGAGTGSVSVQAAKLFPHLRVTAVEQKKEAVELIKQNCLHFGVETIEVIEGKAPLNPLPLCQYDRIYVGGSGGNLVELIDWADRLLKPDCPLVLSFILVENAIKAYDYMSKKGWSELNMRQLEVSDWHALGSGHYFAPNNPTMIIYGKKEGI